MTNYTIAAIPTLYRGRMYRSRLEARWAAFFDRLGWTHEYEPFDLGAWSPDFAITDPFDALIEIKPLTEPDPDLFKRVQKAGHEKGAAVFVMGLAPVANEGVVHVGWWAYSHAPVWLVWIADEDTPTQHADFMTMTSDGKRWATNTIGYGPAAEPPIVTGYPDYTMGLWADASNAVQWEPRS